VIDLPISLLLGTLLLLVVLGVFSGTETAVMAANRFRLRHLAQQGHRGARQALILFDKIDPLMAMLLFGRILLYTAVVTLVTCATLALFGASFWALGISTLATALVLLVAAETLPRAIGAAHADRLIPLVSHLLAPSLRLVSPLIRGTSLLVHCLLRPLHLASNSIDSAPSLNPGELRLLLLESANLIPPAHRGILSNLFELNAVCVEDIMTPRSAIEILDIEQPWNEVMHQLATSHHSRVPVCAESLDHLLGVLPLRRVIGSLERGDLDAEALRDALLPPYYIPAGTAAFAQLAFFQENRQRIGFVIDEYGEILGLLTLDDIVEEIVGQFTTSLPDHFGALSWDAEGCAVVEGSRSLREINRMLNLAFPTDGPKTLNGLILEHFQDIPETGVSFKFAGIPIEVLQTQDRSVRTAKLFRS